MEYVKTPNFRDGDGEEYCFALPVYEEKRLKEYSDDFILPDYLPDIRKVAAVFPDAVIKERFLGSGTLEYSGEAVYKVLYIAEDGSLKSVQFVTGFDDKIGNEELNVDCVDLLTPLCEGVNVRMLNPRKVNVRSMCGAEARLFKRKSCMPRVSGAASVEDEARLQCSPSSIDTVNVLNLRQNALTLSEDLSFDAALPSAEELLFGRASLEVLDCRTAEGEAQVRGKAQVLCIVSTGKDENGKEELLTLDFPVSFSQTVKNDALREGGAPFARLCPEGCEFRLREDEFGQKRVIEFDMTYALDLAVFYPICCSGVSDAFSLEKEVELSKETIGFYRAPTALRGGFSVNESATLDLPEDGGFSVVRSFLEPELRLAPEPDKEGCAVLEGSCRISLLLRDSAGGADVRRTAVPLRFRTDRKVNAPCEALLSVSVSGVRMRLEKNLLNCSFEVNYFGQMLCRDECGIVTELRILNEKRRVPGKRGSVIVCYPEEGESLFAIAKRYGVPPQDLARMPEAVAGASKDAKDAKERSSGIPAASGAPILIFRK